MPAAISRTPRSSDLGAPGRSLHVNVYSQSVNGALVIVLCSNGNGGNRARADRSVGAAQTRKRLELRRIAKNCTKKRGNGRRKEDRSPNAAYFTRQWRATVT
jgi:hypothetical protein